MEQSCYKCGQPVEQGIAFCPNCSAPQIRVVIPEPLTSGADSIAPTYVAADLPPSTSAPTVALPTPWSDALRSGALAALVAFLLVLLRLNVAVAMLAAGFLAVVFRRQRRPGIRLRAFECAKLGALAGIFCCAVISALIAFAATVPEVRAKMQDQYIETAQKVAAWFPKDPDLQASIDELKTPQGFTTALIKAGIGFFILSMVLAAVGGVLGGAIFRRRDKT